MLPFIWWEKKHDSVLGLRVCKKLNRHLIRLYLVVNILIYLIYMVLHHISWWFIVYLFQVNIRRAVWVFIIGYGLVLGITFHESFLCKHLVLQQCYDPVTITEDRVLITGQKDGQMDEIEMCDMWYIR